MSYSEKSADAACNETAVCVILVRQQKLCTLSARLLYRATRNHGEEGCLFEGNGLSEPPRRGGEQLKTFDGGAGFSSTGAT